MQNYHTIPVTITDGENSKGFFAYDDPEILVVFVHGFKGASITTWNHFPEAVTNDTDFSEVDFIFYGYNTLGASASFHAAAFKKFLDKAFTPLASRILPANQGLPERNYKRIVLVAHSLGALIVRQALVSACKRNEAWIAKISLVLFAPAHTGARINNLVKVVFTGLAGIFSAVAKFKYPVYEDLDEGSQFIKTLQDETKKLLADPKNSCHIAKRVVWAENDPVITQIYFCDDPDPDLVYGKNHITVCKPYEGYSTPVDILKEAIK